MFITESNLSPAASETYMDMFAGVWLADYIGSFLNSGGNGVYFFHYLPLQMEHGCNDSPGTFGMFTVDANYQIQQPLSQFFVAQLINLEWVQPGAGEHLVFPAKSDIDDGAGHALVTAYAVKRPDDQWSVMAVNRDQLNAHRVRLVFQDQATASDDFFLWCSRRLNLRKEPISMASGGDPVLGAFRTFRRTTRNRNHKR